MRACKCEEHRKKAKDRNWRVVTRNKACSAFDGYHARYSDYSKLYCLSCKAYWRTKANYVDDVPSLSARERGMWDRGEL